MASNPAFISTASLIRCAPLSVNETSPGRVALAGGPFEEGTFRTLQEKMVLVVQVKITFPTVLAP